MRKFRLTWSVQADVEIDQSVLDAVLTDEWRSVFYNLREPYEVAEMILRCAIAYRTKLSSLDGFADQPDELVKYTDFPGDWELMEWEEVGDD